MHRIYAFALFAGLSTASLHNRASKDCKKHPNSPICEADYLNSICSPGYQSKDVDLNAPCNRATYIGVECVYGSKPNITNHGFENPQGPMQSNRTQQLCICESQYFDSYLGCSSCLTKHGGSSHADLAVPLAVISSMSAAYCVASATPIGILDFQFSYLQKPQFSTFFGAASSATPTTFSDPLANSTAVSLYYTAVVTGSAALDVGVFTATGTAAPTTTTTEISDGLIVATAVADAKTSTSTSTVTMGATQGGAEASTTTTSGLGARQTQAAFAAVLGLVGAVALL